MYSHIMVAVHSTVQRDIDHPTIVTVEGTALFVGGNQQTGTSANSEDPDEMPHNAAAFPQGLHCLQR